MTYLVKYIARRVGVTASLTTLIADQLSKGNSVDICCTKDGVKRLHNNLTIIFPGKKVMLTPIYHRQPPQPVFKSMGEEDIIIGFHWPKKKLTGYTFSTKKILTMVLTYTVKNKTTFTSQQTVTSIKHSDKAVAHLKALNKVNGRMIYSGFKLYDKAVSDDETPQLLKEYK